MKRTEIPKEATLQQTRRIILHHLKEAGEATVEDLAEFLSLTAVTVRHHLDVLREEELVGAPAIRHRTTPGRPQYVYSLTEKASRYFPNTHLELAVQVLAQMKQSLGPEAAAGLLENVGRNIATELGEPDGQTWPQRLEKISTALDQRGYGAHWEVQDGFFVLHTDQCPYASMVTQHVEICQMDQALMNSLAGSEAPCLSRLSSGGGSCAYRMATAKPQAEIDAQLEVR